MASRSLSLKILLILFIGCHNAMAQEPYLMVLGIAQDGGFPQAGCNKECCKEAWKHPDQRKFVSCVAIIDPATKQSWMIDATPDFANQLQLLRVHLKDSAHLPSGIFLTHAHIGHYAGLMQLGREVMGTHEIPVYAMPRMMSFIQSNGPWSQLVKLNNIELNPLQEDTYIHGTLRIHFKPVPVPHRDEYSETVGYSIQFGAKSCLYIPDIDKWEKWFPMFTDLTLNKVFNGYDYILIDGTFNDANELGIGRMKDIPHPFVSESTNLFGWFKSPVKNKIYFIHFNHTNKLMSNVKERKVFEKSGFHLAKQGMILK